MLISIVAQPRTFGQFEQPLHGNKGCTGNWPKGDSQTGKFLIIKYLILNQINFYNKLGFENENKIRYNSSKCFKNCFFLNNL